MTLGKATGPQHRAALVGIVLSLPITIVLSLIALGIEPRVEIPNEAAGIVSLVLMLLLPVALAVSVNPIVRSVRAGQGLFAHPLNLLVGFAIIALMLGITGIIVADQYPCWMGVPNCD